MRIALLIAALILLPACAIISPGGGGDGDTLSDLANARAQWRAQGSSNYDMTMGRWCFCIAAGEYRVSVRSDTVAAVVSLETDQVLPHDQAQWFPTIEGLFDLVESARVDADQLEVRFDASGYVASIRIDYLAQAADDEINYEVKDVEAVVANDLYMLRPGDTVVLAPVTLTFREVLRDSRCARDVVCVWEGQAVVELAVHPGGGPTILRELVHGGMQEGDKDRISVGDVTVRLMSVYPYPERAENPPDLAGYSILLRVARTS